MISYTITALISLFIGYVIRGIQEASPHREYLRKLRRADENMVLPRKLKKVD